MEDASAFAKAPARQAGRWLPIHVMIVDGLFRQTSLSLLPLSCHFMSIFSVSSGWACFSAMSRVPYAQRKDYASCGAVCNRDFGVSSGVDADEAERRPRSRLGIRVNNN